MTTISDGDDLQLNIFSSVVREKTRQHVSGNRQQRIKARRAIRHREAQTVQESVTPSPTEQRGEVNKPVVLNSEGERLKRQTEVKDGGAVVRKEKTGPVISSLFTFNPKIPKIDRAHVDAVKEAVFSLDTFHDVPLHPFMITNLEEKLKLSQMTNVQKSTIPTLLEGHDALVKSQTGSGKTLAFSIPIVQSLQGKAPRTQRLDGPYAVIIVPTRELALQCFETIHALVQPFLWVVPGYLMGGEKKKSEKARLRKGINILIATPGRLLDHIRTTNCLSFERIEWLVIDEADRLLDMGFEKDVSEIVTKITESSPKPPQTVLLSATLNYGVDKLAGMTLNNPKHIYITDEKPGSQNNPSSIGRKEKLVTSPVSGGTEESHAVPENLKQHFVIVPCKLRLVTLATFILWKCKFSPKPSKMIVFLSTQDTVEFHHNLVHAAFCEAPKVAPDYSSILGNRGGDGRQTGREDAGPKINLYKLYGNMPQHERSAVYQEFCEAQSGVLFCTDVAARGLHLPNVQWIIQYTCPTSPTEYIHRVGRTARVGMKGHSLLFLLPEETEYVKKLADCKISMEEMSIDYVLKSLHKNITDVITITSSSQTERDCPRTMEESATYLQMVFENLINRDKTKHAAAKHAFQSFVRGYSTYPSHLKQIFHIKNLHLGHLAKSFGLREAPSNITVTGHRGQHGAGHRGQQGTGQKRKREQFTRERPSTSRVRVVSEFGSGFEKVTNQKVGKPKNVNKHKVKRTKF